MKKLLLSIIAIFTVFVMSAAPVYADCVETSILGNTWCVKDKDGNLSEDASKPSGSVSCSCDNGEEGTSIKHILALVLDIMSIGIGIFGVLGITIVGVQYLTAGGNEEKTRKAKHRLLEIVIGIAAYAVMYLLLRWLLPRYEGEEGLGSIPFIIKHILLP